MMHWLSWVEWSWRYTSAAFQWVKLDFICFDSVSHCAFSSKSF